MLKIIEAFIQREKVRGRCVIMCMFSLRGCFFYRAGLHIFALPLLIHPQVFWNLGFRS